MFSRCFSTVLGQIDRQEAISEVSSRRATRQQTSTSRSERDGNVSAIPLKARSGSKRFCLMSKLTLGRFYLFRGLGVCVITTQSWDGEPTNCSTCFLSQQGCDPCDQDISRTRASNYVVSTHTENMLIALEYRGRLFREGNQKILTGKLIAGCDILSLDRAPNVQHTYSLTPTAPCEVGAWTWTVH
jgi:hypothetical protein